MKNNYILNLRKGSSSGYTFISNNNYLNEFNSCNNKMVADMFVNLEECGYKLLNIDDYPDWVGVPISNIFSRSMLFRDIEFHNTFKTKKDEILVRWYKVERSGYIKMKQVLFTKPEHLQKPVNELVTAASIKNYNITISSGNYKMLHNIIVPYNTKGMLLSSEFDKAVNLYLQDEYDYLSGELPVYVKTIKNIIAQSFLEVTDEHIKTFANFRPKILDWAPVVNSDELFDAHYIRENTYYD